MDLVTFDHIRSKRIFCAAGTNVSRELGTLAGTVAKISLRPNLNNLKKNKSKLLKLMLSKS
jgi:hypothetical protein